jgi:DNA modification methylase
MKPISLLRHLILNSSQIGDYIYDPFGGSGSTLIACEQTKRKCLMIELDPKYCEVIINRYKKLNKI